jgi:hypothetical protein
MGCFLEPHHGGIMFHYIYDVPRPLHGRLTVTFRLFVWTLCLPCASSEQMEKYQEPHQLINKQHFFQKWWGLFWSPGPEESVKSFLGYHPFLIQEVVEQPNSLSLWMSLQRRKHK